MITLQDKLQEELKKNTDAYESYSALHMDTLNDFPFSTAKWAEEEIYLKGLRKTISLIELAFEQNIQLTWEQYQLLDKIFNIELLSKRI